MSGRLQQVVKQFRTQLQHHEATAEHQLNTAYSGVLNGVQPRLNDLYKAMDDKIAAGEDIPLSWLYEERRLEVIKQLVSTHVDRYAILAQHITQQQQQIGVHLGTASAQAQLTASVPRGFAWSFGLPSPAAIAHLVGATVAGSPLADLFRGFGFEAAKNVGNALVTGLSLGKGPREVARDVMQALNIPRQRALTIARTEMLRSYRDAVLENYKANDDVVGSWIWQSALNKETCVACIAMNGTEHPLTEPMASHVNCRCVQSPKTKDWAELLGPRGSSIPETRPDIQPGSDWLDQQDEATQKEILGNKYEGWSSGEFRLEDMVDTTTDPDWGTSVYVVPLKALKKKGKAS